MAKANEWAEFIDHFSRLFECNISFIVEEKKSINLLGKVDLKGASLYCINEEVNSKKKYGYKQLDNFSRRYLHYSLNKLMLHTAFSKGSLFFNNNYQFEQLLCAHLEYFESLFTKFNADVVCFEMYEAYSSINVPIMEAVCNELKILTAFPHHSLKGRIAVYDNSRRISLEVQKGFEEKKSAGMSENDKKKVLDYFEAYKEFKRTIHKKHLFRDRGRHQGKFNVKDVRNFITLQTKKLFFLNNRDRYRLFDRTLCYDSFDFQNDKFVLFLPNKQNNYRTNTISPYYADPSFLVKAISISLPFTHSLVVKDHPHSIKGNFDYSLINTIDRLDNCYYIDPQIDTFDVAEYADVIFYVASAAGLEILTLFKHVACFGAFPMFFGANKTPIIRISNVEELPVLIDKCIKSSPLRDDIMAFFYSLLSNSYSRNGMAEGNWCNIKYYWKEILVKVAAHTISEFILKRQKIP